MSKIIGVTVGTPTSPAKMADEIKPVKTVNGVAPDGNGNVEVEGGLSVTEIESPDDIKADSPDGLYIQEGGTSTPSGGTTIHYYDSLDSVPADLPEGSYVAVPSEGGGGGGGGLPVVDLTTIATVNGQKLSADDSAKVEALKGAPFIADCYVDFGIEDTPAMRTRCAMSVIEMAEGFYAYSCAFSLGYLTIDNTLGEGWDFVFVPIGG